MTLNTQTHAPSPWPQSRNLVAGAPGFPGVWVLARFPRETSNALPQMERTVLGTQGRGVGPWVVTVPEPSPDCSAPPVSPVPGGRGGGGDKETGRTRGNLFRRLVRSPEAQEEIKQIREAGVTPCGFTAPGAGLGRGGLRARSGASRSRAATGRMVHRRRATAAARCAGPRDAAPAGAWGWGRGVEGRPR